MKKVLLIATGGTIASKQTEDGLSPSLSAEEIIAFVPELQKIAELSIVQLCNVDSTNMQPKIWREMGACIQKNYDRYDGFVVLHGTDTMAYTSAALSYMVQYSRKPIVITGSQKPINQDSTDAKMNLLDSVRYACDPYSENVVLLFNGNVISGTRAKKMMARSFHAFQSVNFPTLARMQDGRIIRYIPYLPLREAVEFHLDLDDSICVLKLIPGTRPEMLSYLFENYDCIVMESFGVGGIPESMQEVFYKEMEKWQKKGKIIVMATQVVNEGSNMEIYQVGQKIKKDFQLLEAYDMTLEATITKLMYLMAKYKGDYLSLKKEFYTTINNDILCAVQ